MTTVLTRTPEYLGLPGNVPTFVTSASTGPGEFSPEGLIPYLDVEEDATGSVEKVHQRFSCRPWDPDRNATSLKSALPPELREIPTSLSPQDYDPRAVADILFPLLVDGPDERSNAIFDALIEGSEPDCILDVALREDAKTGGDRAVSLGDSLLRRFGRRAWPALERLSRSRDPNCVAFVDLIATCQDIDPSRRRKALARLARHADAEVRWQVLETLDSLPAELSKESLEILANDPDEDIREAAASQLEDIV